MSSTSQRAAVHQFIAFTQCSERVAIKFLKTHGWNVETAADSYFNSARPESSSLSSAGKSELSRLFDQFRDPTDPPDTIQVNGAMRYLQSLDIGLEEPTVLALSELLRAPTMGEFSRAGFLEGWSSISVSTFDGMRSRVPALRASLSSDEATFKRVYLFTYNFARSPGQKSLALEVATEYWKLLLNGRFPSAHLRAWIEFLEREYGKSVAKDTWNCMYDFVQLAQKDPELKGYDLDGAWPSILDDFVRYWRRKNEMDTS